MQKLQDAALSFAKAQHYVRENASPFPLPTVCKGNNVCLLSCFIQNQTTGSSRSALYTPQVALQGFRGLSQLNLELPETKTADPLAGKSKVYLHSYWAFVGTKGGLRANGGSHK